MQSRAQIENWFLKSHSQLLVMVAASLVLVANFVFNHPPISLFDDAGYAHLALGLVEGKSTFLEGHNFWYRVVVYYPQALFIKLFGLNRYAVHLWGFLVQLAAGWSIFWYAKKLFNANSFWIAAIYLVYPLLLNRSLDYQVDVLVAAFGSVATLAFVYGLKTGNNKHVVLALALIALGFLCKSSIVLFVLAWPILVFNELKWASKSFWLVFLGGSIGLWLLLWALGLDPITRYQAIQQNFFAEHVNQTFAKKLELLLKNNQLWGLLPALGLSVTSLFSSKNESKPYAWWLLIMFFGLFFGQLSFTNWAPLPFNERFYTIFVLPMLLVWHKLNLGKWNMAVLAILAVDFTFGTGHFSAKWLLLFVVLFSIISLAFTRALLPAFFAAFCMFSVYGIINRLSDLEAQQIRNIALSGSETLYVDNRIATFSRLFFEDQLPHFEIKNVNGLTAENGNVLYWHNDFRERQFAKKGEIKTIDSFMVKDTISSFGKSHLLRVSARK
ncbi:MAG: glycosyltransferase family 39 protein [Bacteroidetes bacterium]|nr:glycosyltransferase family 39 protein [Bacteroidota bacterium]